MQPHRASRGSRAAARTAIALALSLLNVCVTASASEQDILSPQVEAMRQAAAANDSVAVERLMQAALASGAPFVERLAGQPGKALFTFVARDADADAPPAIFGMFDWGHLKPFERLGNTQWWISSVPLPGAARGGYWLAWPRGRTADPQALTTQRIPGSPNYELFDDPLAGRSAVHFDSTTRKLGRYGWFEGPAAQSQPYLAERAGVAKGTVVTRTVASGQLGNERMVSIYTPAGYDARGDYRLLVIFDREEYLSTIATPTLLDNMIAERVIPPLVAVFISAIGDAERNVELPGNAQFQEFVHDELLPSLSRDFAITSRADHTVVAGASYGGLCATLLALRYPRRFGNVISQSGAFWWGPQFALEANADSDTKQYGETAQRYSRAPALPLRFYMDVGLLEGDVMILPNRHLRDVLISKGYAVTYQEVQAGHDWISWRATLPDGLTALLGSGRRSAAPR